MSQLKSIAWTAFAMCAIGLAVLVGLGSALLPYAERWTPQVAEWLEQRLGQPVQIDRLSARWEGYGPHLSLQGIIVGSGSETLRIDDAEVEVDMLAFVRPGAGLAHFRVLVDEVVVNRDAAGTWGLLGLPGNGRMPDLDLLQGMGLRAGHLRIRDAAAGIELDLGQLELDLRNSSHLTRLAGNLSKGQQGQLQFVLERGRAGNRIFLAIKNLSVADWQQQLPVAGLLAQQGVLNGDLWGSFSGGQIVDLQWQGSLENLALMAVSESTDSPVAMSGAPLVPTMRSAEDTPAGLQTAMLSLRQASARFSRTNDGWVAQLLDGELETASGVWPAARLSASRQQQQFSLGIDWLPLADVASLLSLVQPLPGPLRQALITRQVTGEASNINVSMSTDNENLAIKGSAEVNQLGWIAADNQPGIQGLDMTLNFAGQQVTLLPSAQSQVLLTVPEVFRWPIKFSDINGPVIVHWADNTQVSIPAMTLRSESVRASLRLAMENNGGLPFVDLQVRVTEGEVTDAGRFWPKNKFQPPLLNWLDKSLLAGTVTGGTALLFGDLDHWPFLKAEGRFEAHTVVEDGRLDYDPAWPVAEEMDAALSFTSTSMSARIPRSQLDTLTLTNTTIELPAYRQPRIVLDMQGRGSGKDFLTFISHTPLYDTYETYLEGLKIDGQASATAHIELPLKKGLPERSVDGVLTLLGADVTDEKWQVSFTETTGDVRFTHEGLLADGLQTLWEGFPSTLRLATGAFVENPAAAAEAQLTGIAPANVFAAELPQLAPLLERIPEACEWVANLMFGLDGQLTSEGRTPRLTVRSSLTTSEVQLPAPLSKSSGESLPMTIGMDLPEFGNLSLDIADLVKFRFRPSENGEPWGGTLHLGQGEPAENASPGLLIEGDMDFIDLDEWQDVLKDFTAAQMPNDQQRWLTSLDLRIGRVRYAYRDFSNLHLRTSRDNNYWTLHISADQMEGTLRVPLDPDGRRLLLAEMERLEWPVSTRTLGSPTVDPASIPPLRFVAGNVSFDGVPYGSVSFESYPVRNGMHIDHLETQSNTMAISANGDWVMADGKSQSRFGLTITGDELGAIFEAFGYSRLIEGGQTIVRLDVNWEGGLSDFEMAILNGDMDVSISNGQIVEVDPGAGRLFGLMSLHSLPRRLTLDFSDLFKTGLTFDTINGNFQLNQGDAYTENLLIKGPTADIEIKGSTNIASQDYDQIVTVIPEVGATLPLVGALAGGAGGAAAAFLLQNMFGRQIDKISQFHYSVTGSFESPLVELIGADDQRLELETARALRDDAEAG